MFWFDIWVVLTSRPPRGVLQILSDMDDRKGAKIKTPKKSLGVTTILKQIPGPKTNPPKSHEKHQTKKQSQTYAAGIHRHYQTTNLQIVLNTPKNPYLNQSTQKFPGIEKSKLKKILPLSPSLEIQGTQLPPPPLPPPGLRLSWLAHYLLMLMLDIAVSQCLTSLISIFLGPSLSAVAANALSTSSAKANAKIRNTVTETIFIIDFLKVISSSSSKTQYEGLFIPCSMPNLQEEFSSCSVGFIQS